MVTRPYPKSLTCVKSLPSCDLLPAVCSVRANPPARIGNSTVSQPMFTLGSTSLFGPDVESRINLAVGATDPPSPPSL